MIRPVRIKGYRLVETRMGDTLQAVAMRYLGDAARWGELATLNNLVDPYIVDSIADLENTPAGRVLLAGQQIKLPSAPRPTTGVAEDVFGTDMRLTRGRLTADPETGDYATISGAPNLTQAISHRVVTDLNELIWHPLYGNGTRRLLGRKENQGNHLLAAWLTERCLRADPRVARTEGVKATVRGDILDTEGTIVAIDGRRLPIPSADEEA